MTTQRNHFMATAVFTAPMQGRFGAWASWASLVFMLAVSLLPMPVWAGPPGEDTVTITNVKQNGIPGGPVQPGKGMPERFDMPINVKAKIARYTAVAMQKPEEYAANATTTIEQSAESAGFTKSCIQDVGSNTIGTTSGAGAGGGRFGPKLQDQIVVLRGDLVNICK